MQRVFALLVLWATLSSAAEATWLRQDERVFFPPLIAERMSAYGSFPLFRWNHFIEPAVAPDDEARWQQLTALCTALKKDTHLEAVQCGDDLGPYRTIADSWARDMPLRREMPPLNEMTRAFDRTLTQASLPLPPDLLTLLRSDPLETYRELLARVARVLPPGLERRKGFLYEPKSKTVLIPVQPAYPPSDSLRFSSTEQAASAACPECKGTWIGPHASGLANRVRVQTDLNLLSWLGPLTMGLFALFFFATARSSLLLLFPVVVVSISLSALILVLTRGGLHGLTLSFGVGLVGLSADYGLHAFLQRTPGVWRSNFAGYLTTMVLLAVLALSTIPLLRELMLFSMGGLTVSFAMVWCLDHFWGERISRFKPIRMPRFERVRLGSFAALLVVGGLVPIWWLKPQFDLRQFDFRTDRQLALQEWWSAIKSTGLPLFEIYQGGSDGLFVGATKQKAWAQKNGIDLVNILDYLPTPERQVAHLATWQRVQCSKRPLNFDAGETTRKFFAPFFEAIRCAKLVPQDLQGALPKYLSPIHSDSGWLAVWLSKSPEQAKAIHAAFPESFSLGEIVSFFPETLKRELLWQVPLALSLVFLFLIFYYRSLPTFLLSIVPFLSGIGMIAWPTVLFGLPFSFISIVALVMLAGFSIDYGIFATDGLLHHKTASGETEPGVDAALWLAGLTNFIGFLPLAFCRHPVLFHLGLSLSLGIAGTLIGTFWGVPWFARFLEKPRARA